MNTLFIFLCLTVLILTSITIFLYRNLSYKINILAKPNSRTLHENNIPTGTGIIFGFTILISLLLLHNFVDINKSLIFLIFLGSLSSLLFGYIDDLININSKLKLIFQIISSFFLIYINNWYLIINIDLLPYLINLLINLFLIVWIFNIFNFMDGSDGFLSANLIYVGIAIIIILYSFNFNEFIIYLLIIIISSLIPFLIFNLSKYKVFMGDSGSLFLGFIFTFIIIYSLQNNLLDLISWIMLFSYFICDSFVTLIFRIIYRKNIFIAHRSHAYQNLVNKLKNHKLVLSFQIFYNCIFVSPMIYLSYVYPSLNYLYLTILFIAPFIITIRFGPNYSLD